MKTRCYGKKKCLALLCNCFNFYRDVAHIFTSHWFCWNFHILLIVTQNQTINTAFIHTRARCHDNGRWLRQVNSLATYVMICVKILLNWTDFQLKYLLRKKRHATDNPHIWIYRSCWTATRNSNYIWKTSDAISFLRSGWGFQEIEKCDFRADFMPFLLVYANMCT